MMDLTPPKQAVGHFRIDVRPEMPAGSSAMRSEAKSKLGAQVSLPQSPKCVIFGDSWPCLDQKMVEETYGTESCGRI